MKKTIHIKNMVCNRCKNAVLEMFEKTGIAVESIELGQVVVRGNSTDNYKNLETALKDLGFEIIMDETEILMEEIKIALIKKIENQDNANLSSFLSKTLNKSYSVLSKLFSKTEGLTIEKYLINLKVEKVKELIQLGQLNFSQIAYSLDYNNSGHLARQFKNVTGLSMTEFKNLHKWNRKPIDQIV